MKRTIVMILALILMCNLVGCGAEAAVEEAAPNELPSQVMVNDVIYTTTGIESTSTDRREGFDGRIVSAVMGDQQPTENDQSNFGTGYGYQFGEKEGTIDIYINDQWWTYATEEVREQLQFLERDIMSEGPPVLTVTCGEQSIEARISQNNWDVTLENGGQFAMAGIGAMGMDPSIMLNPEASAEVWLHWEVMPDVVEVSCRNLDYKENPEADAEEPSLLREGNEAGDSYLLRPESGNYAYEIIATWQNVPNYSGTVHYNFHTEVQ